MPALETVGQYLDEARRLLQDEYSGSYRYPDKDLVEALNIGLQEARRLRPDLFLPLFEVPFVDTAGTIDKTTAITLDPMYRSSLVYYIVGRAQLRDDEPTVDARAGSLLQKFLGQMLTIAS